METLKEWMTAPVIWFATGFVLLLLEFVSPGIIIIFFGIGAWIVAVLLLFLDLSINLQLIIFIISSILLLVSLRKWFRGLFGTDSPPVKSESELTDEFIGKHATVSHEISPQIGGKIEFRGTVWDAQADETIAAGAVVEIIAKHNITSKCL